MQPQTHFEDQLQHHVAALQQKVRTMSEQVERALDLGFRALQQSNRKMAYVVALHDMIINDLEEEIDRLCLEFLVRFQPAGVHLRFAYSTIRVNKDLERVGDCAESIARQVLALMHLPYRIWEPGFEKQAGLAQSMLRSATAAFVKRDRDSAAQTMVLEEEADNLRNQVRSALFRRYQEGEFGVEALNPLLTIARRFERVTDQAKKICEETIYVCTGEFSRHRRQGRVRVLFLDEFDQVSRLAEAVARSYGDERLEFASSALNPRPLEEPIRQFLAEKGITIHEPADTSLSMSNQYNIVIALSENARRALSDLTLGALVLYWPMSDYSPAETWERLRGYVEELASAVRESRQEEIRA